MGSCGFCHRWAIKSHHRLQTLVCNPLWLSHSTPHQPPQKTLPSSSGRARRAHVSPWPASPEPRAPGCLPPGLLRALHLLFLPLLLQEARLRPSVFSVPQPHTPPSITSLYFKFFFYFTCFFLAVLGLCCCTRTFPSCGERGRVWSWCSGFSLLSWWSMGSQVRRLRQLWPSGSVVRLLDSRAQAR